MRSITFLVVVLALLLPLGCGGNDDPTDPATPPVLQPSEFCSAHPDAALPTSEAANQVAVRRMKEIGRLSVCFNRFPRTRKAWSSPPVVPPGEEPIPTAME